MTIGYLKIAATEAFYVYDTSTNDLVKVDAAVHQILDDYLRSDPEKVTGKYRDILSPEDLSSTMDFIERAKKRGLFQPFFRKDFSKYYDKDTIQDLLSNNLQHLVLNISDQCNLRCSYCVYSGHYQGRRIHNDKSMTWDIARQSLDYFLSRTSESKKIKITFYGGEPLLDWRLVKTSVEYVHQKSARANLSLAVVTNATLINEEIIDYLRDNNVWLYVSLDGPSRVNDAKRVYRNGRGTHAKVRETLRKIRGKYPEYYKKRIIILATFDERNQILPIYRYFSTGLFRDPYILIRPIKDFDTDAYPASKNNNLRYQKGLDGLIAKYVKSLKENAVFKFSHLYHTFPLIFEKFPQREIGMSNSSVRPNRVCVPGVKQVFVSSDGLFYTCYNFAPEGYDIGNCETGIDLPKTQKLLETYVSYCDEMCQECWAYRLCSHCFMHSLEKGHLSKARKKENCIRERRRIARDLERYVYIWENEAEFGFDDEASLHGIVSSYQPETQSKTKESLPTRIKIEDI